MKNYIVVMQADSGRRQCLNNISGQTFESIDAVRKMIDNYFCNADDAEFYTMTDFVQAINDDDINIDDSYIAHVIIEN